MATIDEVFENIVPGKLVLKNGKSFSQKKAVTSGDGEYQEISYSRTTAEEQMSAEDILNEHAQKFGSQTHVERMNKFNNYLGKLQDHNELPRIGPG